MKVAKGSSCHGCVSEGGRGMRQGNLTQEPTPQEEALGVVGRRRMWRAASRHLAM